MRERAAASSLAHAHRTLVIRVGRLAVGKEPDARLLGNVGGGAEAREQVGVLVGGADGDGGGREAARDALGLAGGDAREPGLDERLVDAGAGADAALSSEDDTDLLSSEDTGNDSNEEERIEITSLDTEAFPLNTQMAETRENLDVEADFAQVGPQTLNHNHHRTQEEYLFEARSRHEGTHRPHAPKLQSRYY